MGRLWFSRCEFHAMFLSLFQMLEWWLNPSLIRMKFLLPFDIFYGYWMILSVTWHYCLWANYCFGIRIQLETVQILSREVGCGVLDLSSENRLVCGENLLLQLDGLMFPFSSVLLVICWWPIPRPVFFIKLFAIALLVLLSRQCVLLSCIICPCAVPYWFYYIFYCCLDSSFGERTLLKRV